VGNAETPGLFAPSFLEENRFQLPHSIGNTENINKAAFTKSLIPYSIRNFDNFVNIELEVKKTKVLISKNYATVR